MFQDNYTVKHNNNRNKCRKATVPTFDESAIIKCPTLTLSRGFLANSLLVDAIEDFYEVSVNKKKETKKIGFH